MSNEIGFEMLEFGGQVVGGIAVENLLSDGMFCWVYRGTLPGESVVLKIGKPEALVSQAGTTGVFPTRALMQITGATVAVKPQPRALLAAQAAKLQAAGDADLVVPSELREWQALPYVVMPFESGLSLRLLIEEGTARADVLLSLCRTMSRLSKNKAFGSHGDLKPENVLVTKSGIKVLDPGYFGPIECFGSGVQKCSITTPSYYPSLTPDDLFAVGVIAWEVLLGHHPLVDNWMLKQADLSGCGPKLGQLISQSQLLGDYRFSPLATLPRPAELNSSISRAGEALLLKSLRITFAVDGKRELAPGFASFDEFAAALESL